MKNSSLDTKKNVALSISIKAYWFFIVIFIGFWNNSSAQSTQEFITATDTLVVYSSVPNLTETVSRMDQDAKDIRVISDKYIIRVRSAATSGNWINVLAHYTYNRGFEVANLPLTEGGKPHETNIQSYPNWTKGWSHTYGNIEMSKGQAVEVEISTPETLDPNNKFKINGDDFSAIKVHPYLKASGLRVDNGKVYFTITDPGQVVIDINGQMDNFNALTKPLGSVIHALSFFANPVIKKPLVVNNPRTVYVEPGTMLTANPSTFDLIYFKPGVHNIGQSNKIYPGKSYYIPGDAIVFGTFNNENVPVADGFTSVGDRIKIFGYGTISGSRFRHPNYVPAGSTDEFRSVHIDGGKDYLVSGITITDPANFSLYTPSGKNGYVTWAKVIAWRANGDGLAGNDFVNDCFMRTSDDASYTRGNRKRCTFWKDHISAIFYMEQIFDTPLIIEDCDIIYCRSRDSSGHNGGAFNARGSGFPVGKQNKVNLTFRNIRVHDSLSNMAIFNISSFVGKNANAPTEVGCSYDGILFQNIKIVRSLVKQRLLGCAAAPFNGGVIFDNVTFGETLLTPENYTTFFETNEFVNDIWYRMPNYYSVIKNVDSIRGSFTVVPTDTRTFAVRSSDGLFIENSTVLLTATPATGYRFDKWIDESNGTIISNVNPMSLQMRSNKSVTAIFEFIGIRNLTITIPVNGLVVLDPVSNTHTLGSTVTITAKPAIGYKFNGWSGDLNNQDIISTIVMDADKTVMANFVKTNNFAVNYGGDQYITSDGTVYALTSNGAISTNPISGTDDDLLYQTRRTGNDFTINYSVSNGQYEVKLKFAELFSNGVGLRVFDTTIEGSTVLDDFDIFTEAGGRFIALDKTFQSAVVDGTLNIRFFSSVNGAAINAIQITRIPEAVPIFDAPVAQYCYGETLSSLPTTSNNGIIGTWSPALNNLATTTYTFTPTAGQYATSTTLTIAIGGLTTWNGTAWSNGIPNINTKAIITSNYAQPTNLTACSLDITANAVVTVPAGFNLSISGKVTVAPTANFILENNTNLIQLGNSQNEGNTTIKRNSASLMRLDYTLWSSPVTNANQFLTTFSPVTATNRFYTYNASANAYNAILSPGTTPFNPGTGYLIRMPNTHPATPAVWPGSFVGIPNNGIVTIAVANNTFNAIGNPYPSSINANAFIDANVLTEPLYFWRKTNNAAFTSYATYTKAGGTSNSGGLSSIVPNGLIQVGQGFIAKATNSTFIFNNAMRTANNDNQFLKTKEIESHRIWLNLYKNLEPVNQMMVAYRSGATTGIDNAIDGRSFGDSAIALNSSIENQEFVIQAKGLPFEDTDVVPLSFKTNIEGNYSISIDQVDGLFLGNQDIFLKDNLLELTQNIREKGYSFASLSGTFNTRFELVYKNNSNLGLDRNELEANKIIVYKENGLLKINSGTTIMKNVRVFDIQGRLLFKQEKINQNTTIVKGFKASKQTIIVQITDNENKVIAKKVNYDMESN